MMRDREEIDARVRIWRVAVVWMYVRVWRAWEAEGRSARAGRIVVLVV